jgi:ADP-heptose:LPS heptosyltransferase
LVGQLQRLCVDLLLLLVNFSAVTLEWLTRNRKSGKVPKNILVMRTAALGDFVLSIPAMQRLRATYPAAMFTLLTTASTHRETLKTVDAYARQSSPWLELLPKSLFQRIVVFSISSLAAAIKGNPDLPAGSYDACFILNEGISLNLVGIVKKIGYLRLLGVRCRIYGIRTRAFPHLYPLAQVGPRRLEHHVIALMRSVEEDSRVVCKPGAPVYFGLAKSQKEENWAEAKIDEFGCRGDRLIIVAPGSRLEFKRWPTQSYVKLVAALVKNCNTHVAMVGSGPEAVTVAEVVAQSHALLGNTVRLHDLSGQTTITQLAALLRRAAVFIGNDGGTCHLAAAVGCRVVSIGNGAEIPNSVEPWGNQRFTVRFDVPCAPCYSFTHCPKMANRCVTGITVELVQKHVNDALFQRL